MGYARWPPDPLVGAAGRVPRVRPHDRRDRADHRHLGGVRLDHQTQGLAIRLNAALLDWSGGTNVVILLFMNAVLIAAGAFLEPIATMYLLVPLFKPTLQAIGFDLVHFRRGARGQPVDGALTPPVGVGLFLAAQLGGVPFARAARYALPFVLCEIVVILLVTYVTPIANFLPSLVGP